MDERDMTLPEAMAAITAELPEGWTFEGVTRRDMHGFEWAAECIDSEGGARRFYAESIRDAVAVCLSYLRRPVAE